MYHLVWTIDAGQVRIEEDIDMFPLFKNKLVKRFLDYDDLCIILGPKGVGKSLLLKLKSIDCRKRGIACYPSKELIDVIMRGSESFSAKEISTFRSVDQWKIIWRATLSILVLRFLDIDLPNYRGPFPFSKIDPQLDVILGYILRNRSNLNEVDAFFGHHVSPAFSRVTDRFAAFLDRLDETLGKHTGATLRAFEKEGETRDGHLSYDLWRAAQLGLLEAISELIQKNSGIKFYVTCRHEALRPQDSAVAHNILAIILDLRYSALELRQMFELKLGALRAFSPQSFAHIDDNKNIYKQFFGFDHYDHPRVVTQDGLPAKEHIFNCILRHTRGSPREIEDVAREVSGIPAQERCVSNVRQKINEKANDFLDYAKGQALPYYDVSLDGMMTKIPSNVFSSKKLKSLRMQYSSKVKRKHLEDPCLFLFRHGLLGYARYDEDKRAWIQIFSVNDPDLCASYEHFNSSPIVLVHPCLDSWLEASCVRYARNGINIIGHGLHFETTDNVSHVHFGAGKIGMGLVAPLLLNGPGTSLCVVQRYSARWDVLAKEKVANVTIEVDDGGETFCKQLSVISDRVSDRNARKAISEWSCGERNILIITAAEKRIIEVLKKTQSVSTAVRKAGIEQVAAYLAVGCDKRTSVFPFENDEECFDVLRSELGEFPKFCIHDVTVDRLCTEIKVESNRVVVVAEKHGVVYIKSDGLGVERKVNILCNAKKCDLSEAVSIQRMPRLFLVERDEEYRFYHQSKRMIVNATHAAAAIFGYDELLQANGQIDRAIGAIRFFHFIARDPDIRERISPIANFFSLKIMEELVRNCQNSGREVADWSSELYRRTCFLRELYSSAWLRMRQMPDSLGRIMPADTKIMEDRWKSFFEWIDRRKIDAVFSFVDAYPQVGIEVTKEMVWDSYCELEQRYSRVFRHLAVPNRSRAV